jgi:hypothetical protein
MTTVFESCDFEAFLEAEFELDQKKRKAEFELDQKKRDEDKANTYLVLADEVREKSRNDDEYELFMKLYSELYINEVWFMHQIKHRYEYFADLYYQISEVCSQFPKALFTEDVVDHFLRTAINLSDKSKYHVSHWKMLSAVCKLVSFGDQEFNFLLIENGIVPIIMDSLCRVDITESSGLGHCINILNKLMTYDIFIITICETSAETMDKWIKHCQYILGTKELIKRLIDYKSM